MTFSKEAEKGLEKLRQALSEVTIKAIAPEVGVGSGEDSRESLDSLIDKAKRAFYDGEHLLSLSGYEVANLRAAFEAAGYLNKFVQDNPIFVLNNGDWLGMIHQKLPKVNSNPNESAEQLANRARKYVGVRRDGAEFEKMVTDSHIQNGGVDGERLGDFLENLFGWSGGGFFKVLAQVACLFNKKNLEYSEGEADPFANFHEAGPVQQGRMTPRQYMLSLCSKQDAALIKLIWPRDESDYLKRGGDAMLEERAQDGAVYRMMLIAHRRKEEVDSSPQPISD